MIITAEKTKEKQFFDSRTFTLYTKPKSSTVTGLCTTCIHQNVCCLTSIKPVAECEEFFSRPAGEKVASTAIEPAPKDTNCSPEEEIYWGLCSNCENRYCCPSSKTEGGVWYCEEYC